MLCIEARWASGNKLFPQDNNGSFPVIHITRYSAKKRPPIICCTWDKHLMSSFEVSRRRWLSQRLWQVKPSLKTCFGRSPPTHLHLSSAVHSSYYYKVRPGYFLSKHNTIVNKGPHHRTRRLQFYLPLSKWLHSPSVVLPPSTDLAPTTLPQSHFHPSASSSANGT
jgi:hypothetical protein